MGGAPRRHSILGRTLAKYLHLGRKHVRGSSHGGIVLYAVQFLNFPSLINTK